MLSSHAEVLANLAEQTSNYCHQLEFSRSLGHGETKVLDFLMPNGLERQLIGDGDSYEHLFGKRCMRYAHRQSVKVIIALQRYKTRTGAYPGTLEALVPEDLQRIPVDPFDGQNIKYRAPSLWVYSSGTNFTDNGGAEENGYDSECGFSVKCMQNPTFPLVPREWYVPFVRAQECTAEDGKVESKKI